MNIAKKSGSKYFWIAGLIAMLFSLSVSADSESPQEIAKNAFYEIEADPFSRAVIDKAAQNISSAYESEPENPWVLIAISRLVLEMGYKKGDRSKSSSYVEGTVEKAMVFSEQALKTNPDISMTHVQFSRIQMLNGNLKGAWFTLNRAYELDPDGFYPWYFKAVIAIQMKDLQRAESYLVEAENRVDRDYQRSWVAGRLISVAKLIGNDKGIEDAYLKAIEVDPASPHKYGNYANYLKKKKRYVEAKMYYEKAIEISPYRAAIKGLEEVMSLLGNDG